MLQFRVFAKFQHPLDPQTALSRSVIFSAPLVQPFCFQAIPHSASKSQAEWEEGQHD